MYVADECFDKVSATSLHSTINKNPREFQLILLLHIFNAFASNIPTFETSKKLTLFDPSVTQSKSEHSVCLPLVLDLGFICGQLSESAGS